MKEYVFDKCLKPRYKLVLGEKNKKLVSLIDTTGKGYSAIGSYFFHTVKTAKAFIMLDPDVVRKYKPEYLIQLGVSGLVLGVE